MSTTAAVAEGPTGDGRRLDGRVDERRLLVRRGLDHPPSCCVVNTSVPATVPVKFPLRDTPDAPGSSSVVPFSAAASPDLVVPVHLMSICEALSRTVASHVSGPSSS